MVLPIHALKQSAIVVRHATHEAPLEPLGEVGIYPPFSALVANLFETHCAPSGCGREVGRQVGTLPQKAEDVLIGQAQKTGRKEYEYRITGYETQTVPENTPRALVFVVPLKIDVLTEQIRAE